MKNILYKGLLVMSMLSFSQMKAQESSPWEVFMTVDGIVIYSKNVSCDDDINGIYKEYKLLKLENQTSASVELSFNKLAYYNGDCSNCNGDENHVNIKLSPSQVLEGECSSNNDLKVFIKMNNNIKTRTLTDFSLSEVIVTKL